MDAGDVAFWMFLNFPSGVWKEKDVLERCRKWRLQSWPNDEADLTDEASPDHVSPPLSGILGNKGK